MQTITDYVRFLKFRQSYQDRNAQKFAKSNPRAAAKHIQSSLNYAAIIDWINLQGDKPEVPQQHNADDDLFSLNLLDMKDIPEDLGKELNVSQSDTDDAQVLELLQIANRSLDLNELLIGSFRKYKIKHKRNLLTARIYRLIKRDLVHNVGKGKYALGPAPDDNNSDEE